MQYMINIFKKHDVALSSNHAQQFNTPLENYVRELFWMPRCFLIYSSINTGLLSHLYYTGDMGSVL
uniref:Uncharacterized protein n=1 Tax=Anguilla anguilla TaxID=7936 RepID=A0A0E9T8J5_ANGAN